MADSREHGYFWNAISSDRAYDADSFSDWLAKFFTTGVFEGDLQATAAGGMVVEVGTGYANVRGKVRFFDEPRRFQIPPGDSSRGRTDAIMVSCSYADRTITLKHVQGAPGGAAPAPARDGSAWELVIARISVRAGAAQVSQSDIEDTRPDPSLCGIIAGTVKEIDFSLVQKQFNEKVEEFKSEWQGFLDSATQSLAAVGDAGQLAADYATLKAGMDSKAGADLLPRCMTQAEYDVLAENVKNGGLFFIVIG